MVHDLIDKIGNGLKYNLIGKSISILCALLMSILLIRGLGKEEYGLYIYATGIFILLSPLYDLGLTTALIRYVSEYKTKGEIGKIRTLILISIKLKLLFGVILSSAILLIWFRINHGTFTIAVILCISTFISSLNNIFAFSLESFYEQKLLNLASVIRGLFNIALVFFVIVTMPSIQTVIIVGLVPNLLQCIQLGKRMTDLINVPAVSINEDKNRIMKFASSGIASSIIALISYDKSEVVYLGAYRTTEEVATYGLAYDLAMRIPSIILMIIGSMHYVSLTELYTKNRDNLRLGVEKLEKYIFLVSVPICIWSFIEADIIINILYGPSMLDAVFPFRILILMMLFNLAVFPINAVIAVLEKQPIMTLVGAIFAAIKIALDIFLIPRYGINGGLLAVSFIFLSSSTLLVPWAYWKIGKFFPFKSVALFIGSSIPLAVILLLTKSICTNIYLLIIFSLISFISYIALLRLTKAISDEDKYLLMKIDLPFFREIINYL